ncbi:MAG TPA: hypothetical protein VMV24_00825 [Candidatus Dormibacteraeota bacterium]|nr:hypothetical protein [Candidatus Dormibacteraeota bacterium]
MHYFNIKKTFLNSPIRLVIFAAIIVCAVFVISTNTPQKAYAATFPVPANFNWGWNWDGGVNAINLTVTSKQFCSANANNQCAKVVFNYHQATGNLNDLNPYYYVGSCTSLGANTCQADVYSAFTCQGQNPILKITGGQQLTKNMTLSVSYSSPSLLCLGTSGAITVLGGGSLIGNTAWFNTNRKLVTASAEASLLEFLSPTEIYDTSTHSLYETYNNPYSDNQFANGGTQFFNNGDTVYWPEKNLSTGKIIDPTVPISGSANNDCAGGIVVSTNPGYPTLYLLPAGSIGSISTGGIGCFFGNSGANLYSIAATSTSFYSSSENSSFQTTTPMNQLLETASNKINGVSNTKMFYAMFYWTSNNTINNFDTGGAPTLNNLLQINPALYKQTLADLPGVNTSNNNYRIFTSSSCTGAVFPLILINYIDTKGLTNFSNSNVTATFYYGGVDSQGRPTNKWVEGWSSSLQCLFGLTLPKYNPTTSNNMTQTSAFTYIAYPSASVCSTSCSSQIPGVSSSNIDICYNPNTGWTYECGVGATPISNQQTPDLVTDTNYNSDPKNSDGLYKFSAVGGCYLAQLIPEQPAGSTSTANSFKMAWVEQATSDCSSQTYFSLSSAEADGLQALPPLGQQSIGSAATPDPNGCNSNNGSNCLITGYINPLIKFLNVAVSLVVVISVVMGGVQYSTSRDNPEAVKAARKRILNALLGFAAYFLLYAFLNFIIPGGI